MSVKLKCLVLFNKELESMFIATQKISSFFTWEHQANNVYSCKLPTFV